MKVGNYSSLALHALQPQQQQGKKNNPLLFFSFAPCTRHPHSLLVSVFYFFCFVFFCFVFFLGWVFRVFVVVGFFFWGGVLSFCFQAIHRGLGKNCMWCRGQRVCVCTCAWSVRACVCPCVKCICVLCLWHDWVIKLPNRHCT